MRRKHSKDILIPSPNLKDIKKEKRRNLVGGFIKLSTPN